MSAGLKPVPATIQDPPYPADTRTAGWHFRLDCPRVLQSDTWALAIASQWPEARPWLLMLWFTSWQEIPAGSLPNDDPLIAAKIGMSDEMFQGHRAILMRNWYRASDGRLYNPTMVELVKIIIDCKASARERQRRHRAKDDLSQDVTRDTPLQRVTVTDGVVDVDVDVDDKSSSKTLVALAAQPSLPDPIKKTPKTPKPATKGTRLPLDWRLPEDWLAWAILIRPDWTSQGVVRESLTFRDFWHAKAGAGGVKMDWLATWRTWIRRAEHEPTR